MIPAGPFPLELWEILGSVSNSFSFTAVHNQTPHPTLVFCTESSLCGWDPVTISHRGSRQHVCSLSINLLYVLLTLYLHSAVIVSLRNILLMLHISGELP